MDREGHTGLPAFRPSPTTENPPLKMSRPMARLSKQRTIARSACVCGFGYFSGHDVTVEFRPAAANSGLTFVRGDLGRRARIPVSIDYRRDADRRTVLARGPVRVEMVEHVLAAVAGLGIDNCEIWVDQPELPGCDGSAEPFVEALDFAGIIELAAPRRSLFVEQVLRVGDERTWLEIRPPIDDCLVIDYCLDYGPGPIGRQLYHLALDEEKFRRDLAPTRTFLLEQEAKAMVEAGLGTHVRPRDLLLFGESGPIDNDLRFPDECVRHKALDIVGDLALAGCDVIGHVVGLRSGHLYNAAIVAKLLATHAVEMQTPLLAAA